RWVAGGGPSAPRARQPPDRMDGLGARRLRCRPRRTRGYRFASGIPVRYRIRYRQSESVAASESGSMTHASSREMSAMTKRSTAPSSSTEAMTSSAVLAVASPAVSGVILCEYIPPPDKYSEPTRRSVPPNELSVVDLLFEPRNADHWCEITVILAV